MVLSNWKVPAVLAGLACVSLTCVGLVYSQQTGSHPADANADAANTITINEPGKAPLKAVIVKTYQTADGKTAQEVKILSTGEVITLFKGSSGKATDVSDDRFVPSKVDLSKTPSVPAMPAVVQYRTIQEAGKPALKCQVMAEWKTPDGVKASQLKAMDSGEIITIVQTGPVEGSASGAKAMTTKIYHWGKNTTPPAGVPLPPPVVAETSLKTPAVPPLPENAKPSTSSSTTVKTTPAVVKGSMPSTLPGFPTPSSDSSSAQSKTPADLAAGVGMPPLPPVPVPVEKQSAVTTKSMPASQVATSSKIDPLSIPETYATTRTQEKAPALKEIKTYVGDSAPKGPPGSASALAADNGTAQYLPVPMVTVPQGNPPVPPPAQLPKAPTEAPNPTWYVNAFSPPLPPNAVPEAAMQQRQLVQMTPPGYPGMPYPNQAMVGYQYMGPQMGYVAVPVQMPGRGAVPMGYNGPLPPSPFGNQQPSMPMMAQGYAPMMMPNYGNAAMDRPGMSPNAVYATQQAVLTLRTSIYPTQRETAVQQLAVCDPRSNPQIVQLLLKTATEDSAPTVRASCIAGLSLMGVQGEMMMQICMQLKNDPDPRVRQEAIRALARLAPAGSAQVIQPARAEKVQ
jgi:hypothetical protein